MKEIVENLHYAIANDPDPWDVTLYQRAADEIERLRSLITAWADADDAVSRDDYFNTLRIREQARYALRKAVGR